MWRAVAVLAACGCVAASCGRGSDAIPALAPPALSPPPSGAAAPHGDHNPHHGGIVLMNGDLHFEVVATRDGACRVYFSDATRAELPAATASDVIVTISHQGRAPEAVALSIDEGGESWMGRGRPVADRDASLRVAYTSRGQPYFIDVPFPR